jgi:hypothetical protein
MTVTRQRAELSGARHCSVPKVLHHIQPINDRRTTLARYGIFGTPCDYYGRRKREERSMNGLIYLVGLVVVVLAVLSFFGLR